jgi:DNA-binding transcriptional LysR family regulator
VAAGEYSMPRGALAIAAPIVFGRLHVLPIACDFLARHADIDVRMALSDRNVSLIDDHIDVAIRIGALADSRMTATRVGAVRRVVCGSPGFFAAHGMPKRPQDLTALPCVTFASTAGGASWAFARGRGAARPVQIRTRLAVNTAEAAMDAAIKGVGLTRVLSYQAARPVREGKLRIVLREFEPEPLAVSLIHAGADLLPLKLRSFLDFAAPRLRLSLRGG